MKKHPVTVLPTNQTVEVSEDESLLEGLKQAGFYIKSSCGGHASCSDCIVKVESGKDQRPKFHLHHILLLTQRFSSLFCRRWSVQN